MPTAYASGENRKKVLGVLAFALPAVGHVGVVHHHHHEPAVFVRNPPRVGLGPVFVPAFQRPAARASPGLNRRHLRQARHREHRVPQRVVRRGEVNDRKLAPRQRAPDLLVELLLRGRAVIVRDEQEAALEQVLPQPLHLHVGEVRRARVLHQRERALEQRIVRQPDDDGVGDFFFAVVGHLDADLGELGEPDAEVDVGARVVRAPALLLAAVAREQDAAEVEAAGEGVGGGEFWRRAAVEAAPHPLGVDHRDAGAHDAEDACQGPDQPPASGLHGPRVAPFSAPGS